MTILEALKQDEKEIRLKVTSENKWMIISDEYFEVYILPKRGRIPKLMLRTLDEEDAVKELLR
jgi:hypothetical protein